VQDDNDQYVEFKRLEEIVGAYQQLLRVPFSSSVNREPWFFGDLSGAETVGLLTGLPPGTFLVRFSAQHAHCLSAAYVDPSGDITHALITKSSLGYHHGDDDVFPTLHALLAAYQAVLVHPCVEPDLVQQLCEEVRTQARIFKAAEDAADSRDDADVPYHLTPFATTHTTHTHTTHTHTHTTHTPHTHTHTSIVSHEEC
jgi:hypothetical protein